MKIYVTDGTGLFSAELPLSLKPFLRFDKPCEFIVFENGEAGFLGEHSMMDGTSTSFLCHWMLDSLKKTDFNHGDPDAMSDAPSNIYMDPQPLDWNLSPLMAVEIEKARISALALIDKQEIGLLTIPYGRNAIKAFGVSPDSWTQMMIQLAYHRLLGGRRSGRIRPGGTYESAMTRFVLLFRWPLLTHARILLFFNRKYLRGRTEAIRVVTNESMA